MEETEEALLCSQRQDDQHGLRRRQRAANSWLTAQLAAVEALKLCVRPALLQRRTQPTTRPASSITGTTSPREDSERQAAGPDSGLIGRAASV